MRGCDACGKEAGGVRRNGKQDIRAADGGEEGRGRRGAVGRCVPGWGDGGAAFWWQRSGDAGAGGGGRRDEAARRCDGPTERGEACCVRLSVFSVFSCVCRVVWLCLHARVLSVPATINVAPNPG